MHVKSEIKDYYKRALESSTQPELTSKVSFQKIIVSIYLFSGCAGSSLLLGLSLVASGGCSLVAVPGLLIATTLLIPEHRLQGLWAQ